MKNPAKGRINRMIIILTTEEKVSILNTFILSISLDNQMRLVHINDVVLFMLSSKNPFTPNRMFFRRQIHQISSFIRLNCIKFMLHSFFPKIMFYCLFKRVRFFDRKNIITKKRVCKRRIMIYIF